MRRGMTIGLHVRLPAEGDILENNDPDAGYGWWRRQRRIGVTAIPAPDASRS